MNMEKKKEEIKYRKINEPVTDEEMERMVQIMLDSPTIKKLSKTKFAITALKPAVMWQIAQEATKISIVEKATFSDVLRGLSQEIPSVCKIITLAMLNNKERIQKEYDKVYDTLLWECDVKEWAELLYEVLNLISIDTFFLLTELTQTFKTIALERKTKIKEQKS